jgi:hypothetical protein
VTPGGSLEVEVQVMQLLPPLGMALSCKESDKLKAWLESMLAKGGKESDGESYVQWGCLEPEAPPAKPATAQPAAPEAPQRIADMTTTQKLQLALHGDKNVRALLIRDTNKMIHTYIIQNKGITLDEVKFIAGYRQTNPEVLKTIAENREWMQNPGVALALVTNPKTPSTTATKVLPMLPVTELRRLAKSQNVPRVISTAARRLVVGD